jgi:hypothetical protein
MPGVHRGLICTPWLMIAGQPPAAPTGRVSRAASLPTCHGRQRNTSTWVLGARCLAAVPPSVAVLVTSAFLHSWCKDETAGAGVAAVAVLAGACYSSSFRWAPASTLMNSPVM